MFVLWGQAEEAGQSVCLCLMTLIDLSFFPQCTSFQPIRWQSKGHLVKAESVWIRSSTRILPPQTPSETLTSTAITPNLTEHGWEGKKRPHLPAHSPEDSLRRVLLYLSGHSPADYRLLSVHVMIRHGDRFPLYSIPKTKKPAIDCVLSDKRYMFIYKSSDDEPTSRVHTYI